MKLKAFFITIFLLMTVLVWAQVNSNSVDTAQEIRNKPPQSEISPSNESVIDSETKSLADFDILRHYEARLGKLENNVHELQDRIVFDEKTYDKILEAQRCNYAMNVSVLIGLSLLIISLNGIYNFFVIKKDLRRDMSTAAAKIRDEFANHTKELIAGIKNDNEIKFQKVKGENEDNFNILMAEIYNAVGRLYEEHCGDPQLAKASYHLISAMWYARELEGRMSLKYDEDVIKNNLERLTEHLNKACKIHNPGNVSELQTIISDIDDTKFKAEKERLQSILKARLQDGAEESS